MLKTIRVLQALGPIDARSIARDPLLRWLIFYPMFIAGMLRWGTPALSRWLSGQWQFDLAPYYPLVMTFVLVMTPMLAGIVIGFLLLDQRDDRTLMALQVTPLTLNGYLIYRLTVPLLLGVIMTMIIFPLAGLVELGFWPLLWVALSAAPLAPLYALVLAAFAGNKVQGFAMTKALGVLFVFPVVAWFVPLPWQLAFGLVPLYWPAKFYWQLQAGQSGAWLYGLVGLGYQALLLGLLLRRFNRIETE